MSHEVEQLVYFGSTPWHKEGTKADEADLFDLNSFSKKAGLDWSVRKDSLMTVRQAKKTQLENLENFTNIGDKTSRSEMKSNVPSYAVVRESDDSVLGVVGPHYRPLQNSEAFDFFQTWLDSKEVMLHTAGSLFNGKKVWILAQLAKDPLVKINANDDVAKFILLSNSHDGSSAVRVGFSPIRVVCANTLSAAHSNQNSKLLRLWHSRQVQTNLVEIKSIMDITNQEFKATAEKFQYLSTRDICSADLKKYVKTILEMDLEDEDKNSTRIKNIFDKIVRKMDAPNQSMVGTRGTYWGAYNCLNEHLNYDAGRNFSTRMNNLWFGTSQRKDKTALDLAIQMAG